MLSSINDLIRMANDLDNPKKMAVVFAHDEPVIDAVKQATDHGVIHPVLIGDKEKITALIKTKDMKAPFDIIDETDATKATRIAMHMVNDGDCDIVMKGLIDTHDLLKGVVSSDYGIKKSPLLSHVGIVSYPTLDRILFASDGAMNIEPDVWQKIRIIENAVFLAKTLGYANPKVGLVSSVEKVNPKIKSTVEAKEIVDHYNNDDEEGFVIDGPFAVDNLVSMESKEHKNITSDVAGVADILIFPNLDAGNIFYKTSVFLANGESAGIVVGAKVPIVLTSRADSAKAKFNSIMLAAVMSDGLSDSDD